MITRQQRQAAGAACAAAAEGSHDPQRLTVVEASALAVLPPQDQRLAEAIEAAAAQLRATMTLAATTIEPMAKMRRLADARTLLILIKETAASRPWLRLRRVRAVERNLLALERDAGIQRALAGK